MTLCDNETLCLAPDGWFSACSLHYYVRRNDYRCERLMNAGMLETRIMGTFPTLYREYRRTAAADAWLATDEALAMTRNLRITFGATKESGPTSVADEGMPLSANPQGERNVAGQ